MVLRADGPLARLAAALAPHGLVVRGGLHPGPGDDAPAQAATLVLVGNRGRAMWPAFESGCDPAEAPHALDGWTRRVLEAVAADAGATALYPFGGPPWWPFQRWARAAEGLRPAPIGVLLHPRYGPWHAYRGALAFLDRLALPPVPAPAPSAHPCETCDERPCLTACPVAAFDGEGGYDAEGCRRHVGGEAGATCRTTGCLARHACPVGRAHAYPPTQAAHHMAAFLERRY